MRFANGILLSVFLVLPALAVDYKVAANSDPLPTGVSKEIAQRLSPEGFKVIRGTSRTVCEVWPCKQWEVDPNFKPSGEVLYPFKQGQLIGVARLPRQGDDFRDQEIEDGVYTLRYAQQPVDGAHVGTFPTRDFLLMVNAGDDQSAADLEAEQLINGSADAAQSSHPALLCLLKASDPAGQTSIRHDENRDWWIVSFQGHAVAAGESKPLTVDLVVVGMADE